MKRSRFTKGEVLQAATLVSQSAQHATAALRRHGWRTRWSAPERASVPTDAEWRRMQLERALRDLIWIERNAGGVRRILVAYLEQEGYIVDVREGVVRDG